MRAYIVRDTLWGFSNAGMCYVLHIQHSTVTCVLQVVYIDIMNLKRGCMCMHDAVGSDGCSRRSVLVSIVSHKDSHPRVNHVYMMYVCIWRCYTYVCIVYVRVHCVYCYSV